MPPTDQVKAVCTNTGFDKGEGPPGQYLEGTGSWSPVGFAVGPNDGKSYPTRGCETPACLAAMDICDPGKYQGQDLVRFLQRWTNPTKVGVYVQGILPQGIGCVWKILWNCRKC
jgi:hypothetical protein